MKGQGHHPPEVLRDSALCPLDPLGEESPSFPCPLVPHLQLDTLDTRVSDRCTLLSLLHGRADMGEGMEAMQVLNTIDFPLTKLICVRS